MKKLKAGDRVRAVKNSPSGWYRAGDVFTVVYVGEEHPDRLDIVYPGAPRGVLSVIIHNFRPVKTKKLPAIKNQRRR